MYCVVLVRPVAKRWPAEWSSVCMEIANEQKKSAAAAIAVNENKEK